MLVPDLASVEGVGVGELAEEESRTPAAVFVAVGLGLGSEEAEPPVCTSWAVFPADQILGGSLALLEEM